MAGSFTSADRTLGLLCLGGCPHWLKAQATGIQSERCVTEPGSSYSTSLSSVRAETSELHFIQESEISGPIDQFLLIDAAAQPPFGLSAPNIIHLSDWQIKIKPFLKNKSLLIAAESYKQNFLAPKVVRYRFLVTKNAAEYIESASLKVFAPAQQKSDQKTLNISANQPIESELDDSGSRALLFSIKGLGPRSSAVSTGSTDCANTAVLSVLRASG